MIKYKIILLILGILLLVESVFMLLSTVVALAYSGNDIFSLAISSFITFFVGFVLWIAFRKADKKVERRESYIIVSSAWFLMSLFGALPYFFFWKFASFPDAFFESVSGFTTTGSSVISNLESMPHGLLFWRSLTQFIGGLGFIVFSMAFISIIKTGETKLYSAESTWLSQNKIHPRNQNTAMRIIIIYLSFTALEVILLWLGGMSLFDAVCHSFTTMSSGGFSTHDASIAAYHSPYIEYVIIFFMIISGVNFSVLYFLVTLKFTRAFKNTEFKFYLSFLFGVSIILALILMIYNDFQVEESFRDSLFHVISIVTTTGFSTSNYLLWHPGGIWILLFFLMLVGGSSYSTSGGLKMIRLHILLKNVLNEFKRIIHPHAIIPIRYNKIAINTQTNNNILIFFVIYVFIVVLGTIVMDLTKPELDPITAFGATVSSLANVGISIGDIGHSSNYSEVNSFGKLFLSFLMIVGRLEIFTVLVLFTKSFWKK